MIKNNNNNNKINILVPNLPESVIDATVAVWHKKVGDNIKCDEILLEIETDKIMLDIPAPNDGVLSSILQQEGSIVTSGQILGQIYINYNKDIKEKQEIQKNQFERKNDNLKSYDVEKNKNDNDSISPVVRQLLSEHNLNLEVKNILGSGIKGRLTRQDIDTHLNKKIQKDYQIKSGDQEKIIEDKIANDNKFFSKKEKRVLMSRLRKRVAERLLDVKNNTAMLTTFNEVNMNSIIILRETYGKIFEKVHNVKLGFMSFFVKATLQGLKKFPEINASIDGEEIVYHNYFDISIAVSTDRGLITPVLKDVDKLEIFDIEKNIKLLAEKARNKKLTLQELNGGNFTITNGGIFGSLMSTPIINPPQSAILGMHAIKNRPIVFKNEIKIFPMMYLALSYDHRLIDGKDAVGFLVLIKELLEDPIRLLLHI